jgi:hypothetical protein
MPPLLCPVLQPHWRLRPLLGPLLRPHWGLRPPLGPLLRPHVLVIALGLGRAQGYSIEIQEPRREPRFLNRDRITLRETQTQVNRVLITRDLLSRFSSKRVRQMYSDGPMAFVAMDAHRVLRTWRPVRTSRSARESGRCKRYGRD